MMSLGGTANSGKPKLLAILGAGSSIPCGMPSVGDINEQMKAWSQEWKPTTGLVGDAGTGVFNELWKIVEEYYQSNHYGIGANYERVLGEMTALASWLTPSPFGNALRAAVQDGAPVSAFALPPEGTEKNSYRNLIVEQQGFILGKLAEYMRECSRSLDTKSSPFAAYRNIFLRLREQFDLGIYNLNYDNVARSAWPEAFSGFNRGVFEPKCIGLRNEWAFKQHLNRQLTVVPFLQQHEFENSLLNRVAIWHGGFIEALGSFDKIANRLHGR